MSETEKIENYLKCVEFQTDFALGEAEVLIRNVKLGLHLERKAKEICREIYYENSS